MSENDKPTLPAATDALPEETQRVLEAEVEKIPNLPRQAKEQVFAIIARHSVEHHSGPLPPPRTLAGYEETLPGAAERILAMAERDLAHTHSMQAKIVDVEARERSRGQWLGATVTIVALGASTWMAVAGYPWAGGLLGGLTLLGIVATLVGGREYLLAKLSAKQTSLSAPKDAKPIKRRR